MFYRGQIFQIESIDNLVQPTLFKLVDLMKDPVKGNYYREQLKPSEDPTQNDYWTVEKVLRTRTRKGKKEQFVKFLWYPGFKLIKKAAMSIFSKKDFIFELKHIPYRFKLAVHSKRKDIDLYTFDFRIRCLSLKELRNSNLYKFVIKYQAKDKFIVVCCHSYFERFGPKLNGILTRQMKRFKKKFWPPCKKKRCCEKLLLLPKEEWLTPVYKTWKTGGYLTI